MSFFLSIGFLVALPLIVAPLLLHLFDRRRNVVIEWGAMQFLQDAVAQRTSSRRMQQLLLLLLRMLAIGALIFALARPLLPVSWLGSQPKSDVIVIVDNSLSTQRKSGDERLLDQLLTQAEQACSKLGQGDSIRILVTSPYPTWVTPVSIRVSDEDFSDYLATAFSEIRPTTTSGNVLAALTKAVQSEPEDASIQQRQVVLLADQQRADWMLSETHGWAQFRDQLEDATIPTELEVVQIEDRNESLGNVSLTEVRSQKTIVGVGQEVHFTASLHNFSNSPAAPSELAWKFIENDIQTLPVSTLEPGETQELKTSYTFASPGVYEIECTHSAEESLTEDNIASAIIEVVDQVPVLVIESSDSFAELQQDAYLLKAALGRIEGENISNWSSVFAPRTIAPLQMEVTNLNDYSVVVIPNFTSLSDASIDALKEFVYGGGGLWLALGPRSGIEQFNDLFYEVGDGLSPVGIQQISDESKRSEPTRINPFVKPHPATVDLANHERLDLGEVKIESRFKFRLSESSDELSVLLNLTTEDPLVVENQYGQGRVIVQGIPLRFQWSELATSQSFVVMIENWMNYLAEPSATDHNLQPGQPISMISGDPSITGASLLTPTGEELSLSGEVQGNDVLFHTSRTILPGRYYLDFGLAGESTPFYVSRPAIESDLSQLNENDAKFLTEFHATGRSLSETDESVQAARNPMWSTLIMLLIAVMAAELILSGWMAQSRFGLEEISETAQASSASIEISAQSSSFASTIMPQNSQQREVVQS